MSDDIRFFRNRTGQNYVIFRSYGSRYFVAKGKNRLVIGKYKHRCRTVKKVFKYKTAIRSDLKKTYVKALLYDHGGGLF